MYSSAVVCALNVGSPTRGERECMRICGNGCLDIGAWYWKCTIAWSLVRQIWGRPHEVKAFARACLRGNERRGNYSLARDASLLNTCCTSCEMLTVQLYIWCSCIWIVVFYFPIFVSKNKNIKNNIESGTRDQNIPLCFSVFRLSLIFSYESAFDWKKYCAADTKWKGKIQRGNPAGQSWQKLM